MSNELQFDPVAGENVKLSKSRKEATWAPTQSGGWAYCACAMKLGESTMIELKGSGHCVVGFTPENPELKGRSGQMLKMKKLNDIRLHKRMCQIHLTLEDNAKEVFSVFEGNRVTKKVGRATQVWTAVYVYFGNVTISLCLNGSSGERLPFSSCHGTNILLEDRNLRALTISNTPAAICFLNIKAGETIQMMCSPVAEGSRDPSRYHVNIQVSDKPPTELKRHFPGMFDTCANRCSQPALISMEVLEKEICKGKLSVGLTTSNMLEYTTSSGKRNQQRLTCASSSVWIVLGLYRVSVRLLEKKILNNAGSVCGTNVTDSRVRDPSNCNAENSLDVFNTQCTVPASSYVSVTDVKQMATRQTDRTNFNEPSYVDESQLLQRMDRFEQRQEEILQMLQSHGNCPLSTSSICTTCSSTASEELTHSNLQLNWVELVNTMRVDSICDHLYQHDVIDEHDMHRILTVSKDDQRDANRKLLDILIKKRVKRSLLSKILDDAQESHLKPLFFPSDSNQFVC